MPMYISKVTSEIVVEPAAGLNREQMQEVVRAVVKALEQMQRQDEDAGRATQIREKARAETPFE